MGCCMSSPEDKEGKRINDDINNQLIQERVRMRNEVKMLLLGKYYKLYKFTISFLKNK